MLTDAPQRRHLEARNFALRAVGWSLGLFGLLRFPWVEAHAIVPLTRVQAFAAQTVFGTPALPIDVTLACSGADALALCAAAILAYPVKWPPRLAGVAWGTGVILALNTVRIGTLGRAAASPALFNALHVFIWPALLILAVAGYVFGWMRFADRPCPFARPMPPGEHAGRSERRLPTHFIWLSGIFVVAFVAASPLYLESAWVVAVAAVIAHAAALILGGLGVEATAAGNVLSTSRGAFLVTQECITTPLIPFYLAAVVAFSGTWFRSVAAVLAGAPLFVGLGVARLLVVALPAALIGSPLFLIHAFYQLLLGIAIVCFAAASWHRRRATAWRRGLAGIAVAALFVTLLGPAYGRALEAIFASNPPFNDPQGAIAFLPSFQIGFYLALSVALVAATRWRAVVLGLLLLGVSHAVAFAAGHALMRQTGFAPHVRDVRGWALAAPVLLVAALLTHERAPR